MTECGGQTIMFLTSTGEVPVSQLDWDIKYLHWRFPCFSLFSSG